MLANGCGLVSSSGLAASGEAGAIADGSSMDGGRGLNPSSCQPADVETYVPGQYHPATAQWQGLCTLDQIAGFYDACLVPTATPTTCSAYPTEDAGNGGCAACILTPDSASAYGPLVNHGTFITSNVAGCIQLTLPSELSCAKAEAALVGCELAACEANCPVANSATRHAYDSCASAADGAGCQSYAQMAACVQPPADQDAGAAAACLQSFKAFYDVVVPLFCGPPPPPQDAGPLLVEAGGDAGLHVDAGSEGGVSDAGGNDSAGRDAAVGDTGL